MQKDITVLIQKLCNGMFVFRVCDFESILYNGIAEYFDFKYNTFSTEKVKIPNVKELVFDF